MCPLASRGPAAVVLSVIWRQNLAVAQVMGDLHRAFSAAE